MTHKASNLPSYVLFITINFVNFVQGTKTCEGYPDCVYKGYTCKSNKCICDPDSEGLRNYPPCDLMKTYGERCTSDFECSMSDPNLHCAEFSDIRICKCKKGMWDGEKKSCYIQYDGDIYNKFDPVKDLIIPAIIVMTIGAMVYLGFKLFCNCGKLWRRRRHQEIAREFEEISATPHQQATWIASYRVFSPYNNANRSSSGLSPTSFPIHPTPCMGLFVPSQTISTSPPSYEEALKHKVILSSYHPPPPGPQVVPVPAYTLPPPDVSRQYQTLPANSSGPSSTIILNPNAPTASTIRISTMSGPRSLPIAQTDNYIHDPLWTHQYPYSGTTGGQIWNPGDHHHHQPPPQQQQSTTQQQPPQFQDVWMPQNRNQQQDQHHNDYQNRTSTFRPGPQTQRTYQNQGPDPTRSVQTNDRDN